MRKKEIRKEFLLRRTAIEKSAQLDLDARMTDIFNGIALQGVEYLLTYFPMPDRKEFAQILQWPLQKN